MVEIKCKITDIINETSDVKTFRLTKPEDFSFTAGQFCMISFEKDKGLPEGKKPITFSSSPSENYIDLTVKEVGTFTQALFKQNVGDSLIIEGPRGKTLNFDESVTANVVFVAGGSGVTPFMSSIRYALAKKMDNNIILLFGNRTCSDIIYRDELVEINNNNDNIKIINCLSRAEDDKWDGDTGYVNKDLIEKYISSVNDWTWYICGPPVMNKSVKEILLDIGVEEENLRMDKWELPGKHE